MQWDCSDTHLRECIGTCEDSNSILSYLGPLYAVWFWGVFAKNQLCVFCWEWLITFSISTDLTYFSEFRQVHLVPSGCVRFRDWHGKHLLLHPPEDIIIFRSILGGVWSLWIFTGLGSYVIKVYMILAICSILGVSSHFFKIGFGGQNDYFAKNDEKVNIYVYI